MAKNLRCIAVALIVAMTTFATSIAQERSNEELLRKLQDGDPALVRQAAESIQKQTPQTREELNVVTEGVKSALSSTRDRSAEVALRLALGKLAAAGVEDAAEWGFESMSVTHRPNTPPEVFAAHVRALEMVPGAAKELMIGNLDVALNFPEADPKERQRLKEFVTLTAEQMRTRELAEFLDALLTGEEDLLAKIEAPLEARLIACYQNVKADPPINADVLAQWLGKHQDGPTLVDAIGLETVLLVGTTQPEMAAKLADRLLLKPEVVVAVAKRIGSGRKNPKLKPLVVAALRKQAAATKSIELTSLLRQLERTRD
jgi:hypothetical protein